MIAIIDYKAGNIRSLVNAFNRLGVEAILTKDASVLRQADKVIFPGVGEAASAMQHIRANGLDELIPQLKQPVLGICLGLQLMCSHSEERDTPALGIFKEKVKRFPPLGNVPHIGWNDFIQLKESSPLFKGIQTDNDVYFVHSYYAELGDYTAAVSEYLIPFSASLQKDNFYAVQFHPEKSAAIGDRILSNFLNV